MTKLAMRDLLARRAAARAQALFESGAVRRGARRSVAATPSRAQNRRARNRAPPA